MQHDDMKERHDDMRVHYMSEQRDMRERHDDMMELMHGM